jgi:DMSO/TMAO reductase YedYZ molybdopterin-dependent catalytic subunit
MKEGLRNEEVYVATREEQLLFDLERRHGLTRRQVLKLAGAGLLVAGLGRFAAPAAVAATGPIQKLLPPEWFVNFGTNAEMRWDTATDLGYTIPNARFFVRDHTSTPTIDARSWRLSLYGSGLEGAPGAAHAVQFTYDDLRRLPERTAFAFIECAGNGRSFFGSQQGTPAGGTQWHLGAIGVAHWRGVMLSEVLERAGLKPTAVDVMPQGLDGTVVIGGADAGHVRRPLPVEKALDDVLLAYEMNGEPLPLDHGFPVRLVVPGWVGIASIKWVGQIEVSETPLFSAWNTVLYRMIGPSYPPDEPPLTRQPVKSAFELAFGAQLPAGRRHVIRGRSWSGNAPISRVEVSVDGGRTWSEAHQYGPNFPNAWVQWRFTWTPTQPGSYELQARATDESGATQPTSVPFNTGGYLFWAVVKHPVVVT